MLPSYDPLRRQDRGHSNTHAKSQRFVRKGFHHPFVLHSGALAITSPSHKVHSLGMFPNGAQVLVTSALSAPGEGRSRVGRKNLPRIRSSEIMSTLCTPFVRLQTLVCVWPLCPVSAKDSSISIWPVRTGQTEIPLVTATSTRSTLRPVHN